MSGPSLILSVSQFLDAVNLAIEASRDFEVQGEVTDFKKGKWISLTLKDPDDGSLLKCVMGEWTWRRVGIDLEDGMLVKITGNAKLNKKYGSFGMWVETIEPLGEGSLKKAYELLLKKLQEEGLFDRKRAIPEYINRIGVASSRHGVVTQDFMKNLEKRGYSVVFVDTRVEGEGAVQGIVSALRELGREHHGLDLIVVIRGGGSLESMQAFNNEAVARAIFASRVPTIAGIGHDVDVPIACKVADTSASTPTATAHLINQSWSPLTDGLPSCQRRLIYLFEKLAITHRHRFKLATQHLIAGLGRLFSTYHTLSETIKSNLTLMEQQHYATSILVRRGASNIIKSFETASKQVVERVTRAEQYLAAVNPERNLRLGYSIVRNTNGRVIKSVNSVLPGEDMTTRVQDGTISSTVESIS
ncbi:MAG: exodeoxyribonuclease VII large subunit [Candidatus Vogelbacteria bacterium CG10_big_fil_rev_8_21_14_0_10_51_16]|uniref:Exodeoxyribonuclease 7 large subunit n=1 Tax=Candidatus Vogelbacteria bacterium CG10_big_fil_rev_8_21_14_0_10_51_16 TaxID=1975045 RepID=A0A2H0RDZ3_9BACT|nr:MAG: exodeoxyribonuclease VII large subunit [Candidatus Vogelbacteria bacterium CG10_big_fil_rev_8_21_14_0_10_51_16]